MEKSGNMINFIPPFIDDEKIMGLGVSESEINITTEQRQEVIAFRGDTLDNEGFRVSEEFQDRRNTKNLDMLR